MRTNINASGGVRKGVLEERTRIDKLENENYELKLKIRLLERKQASLPAATTATEHAPGETELLQENAELKETIYTLEQRLQALPEQISQKYQKDVDDYFEQVRTELIAKRQLEQRVTQLESSQVFQNTPPIMTTVPVISDSRLDELNLELAAARNAKIEAEKAAVSLEAKLQESNSQEQILRQDLSRLESQLAHLLANKPAPAPVTKPELNNFHELEEFKNLEAQISALKTDNTRLEEETTRLQSCLQGAESQLRNNKRLVPDTTSVDTEALEHKYQSQIRRLESQLAGARKDLENNIQPHELAVAQAELSRIQVQLAELEGRNKVLENQLRGAQLQIELGDNKYRNLEKRYIHKKEGDMRAMSQKIDLERQLESSKVLNIELEDQTQVLKTTLARESRARQVIEQRNTELEQVLARHREPSRVIDSNTRRQTSRNHSNIDKDRTSIRTPLESSQKENSYSPLPTDSNKDMAALKLRLGIDSAMEGF